MRLITRPHTSHSMGWLNGNFDHLIDGFFGPMRLVTDSEPREQIPAVDISESDNEFIVRADIPGVLKDDVSVTVENGVLTIFADSKNESEKNDGERIIRQERRFGKYLRRLRLGVEIDESNVKATHKDGVLEVVLPKAEKIKPKRINIDVG